MLCCAQRIALRNCTYGYSAEIHIRLYEITNKACALIVDIERICGLRVAVGIEENSVGGFVVCNARSVRSSLYPDLLPEVIKRKKLTEDVIASVGFMPYFGHIDSLNSISNIRRDAYAAPSDAVRSKYSELGLIVSAGEEPMQFVRECFRALACNADY